MQIIRINELNYSRFDEMVYWRLNGCERKTEIDYVIPDDVRNELMNDNLYIFSAVIEGKPVGWISLVYIPKVGRFNGKGHVYVDELWVAPSYRGRGISKQLMSQADKLVDQLDAMGSRLYVSNDNSAARACYESCGYEYSGEAVFMEKK